MKVKAKIFQIIKWEEKEKYFYQTDFENTPMDMLHLASIDDGKQKWYFKIGLMFPFMLMSKDKPFKYHNMMFKDSVHDKKGNYVGSSIPMLVPRPNNFKVGDIVEINYEVKMYGRL